MRFSLLVLVLLLLLLPSSSHVCKHDAYVHKLKPAVKAPPSDGAGARRNTAAAVAPIRIKAIYAASNGGTDIGTEAGMTPALKTVLTAAVSAALARFAELLRVRPVSGPLFAFRECIEQWEADNSCSDVDPAPVCGGAPDDVAISLRSMLGSQVYYPSSPLVKRTLLATGPGIADTDTAIFVTAKQTSDCGSGGAGTVAYASGCQRASDDRPTFGRINFCPAMLPPSVTDPLYDDLVSTALHELTHVLVFSSALFPYFRDDAGVERTPRDTFGFPADNFYSSDVNDYISSGSTVSYASERGMDCSWGAATSWAAANIPHGLNAMAPGDCVARLSTPRVKAAARAFFGCDLLEGAELENQDTSDEFVQGSHWEARTLAGEFMAAYSLSGQKISAITLAMFEDSGWYMAAYANGDKWVKGRDWGYKQGCAFARDKCSAANAGSPPHFFLGSPDASGSLCSVDRSAPAYTLTKTYPYLLPTQYRYFASPRKGGAAEAFDYCPAVLAYPSLCESPSTAASAAFGEVVGAGSKCFVSTLNSAAPSPPASYGGCYRVACTGDGLSYSLATHSGATATCASDGAVVTFPGYGGSVVCGDPAALCSAGEAWVPACAAGFALDAATSACTSCPIGQYRSINTSCVGCGAGYYGSATAQTAATCSGLLFCGLYGAAGATAFNGGAGACAAGRYGLATSVRTAATCDGPCSAGHWCGAGSCRATQNACPPGKFNALTGQASAAACLPCASGEESGLGAASCRPRSLTATPSRTPSRTASGTASPSNTPLATPSPGSAVLRLSLIFAGSTGAFPAAAQGPILTATAASLAVPRAAIGWLGVTSPAAPGLYRQLQAGARVQLSLQPAAASASALIQAAMAAGGGGGSLPAAVSTLLSSGLPAALAAQPDAAMLATALGYGSTAAMASSLGLDPTIPIAAVVMSATPSPSPRHGAALPDPATGALVGGILGGSALALYLITISIVACCVKCSCCCQHAMCKARYMTRSIWCCCCRVTPPPTDPAPAGRPYPSPSYLKPAGMVMRSAAV